MKIFFGSVSKHPEKIWIIDELYNAMKSNLKYHQVTDNPDEAEIMIFDGCRIVVEHLKVNKTIFGIYIVHHIENSNSKNYMFSMDKIGKCIKVINYIGKDDEGTLEFLKKHEAKKSIHQPFGIDSDFCCLSDKIKKKLRKNYKIPTDGYVIGSFIRVCGKSSKNIELFFQCILYLKTIKNKIFLLITGEERSFTIDFCKKNKIEYLYKNPSNYKEMNNFYNCLDLYIITSRAEGSPMQLYECALTKTPQVATRVGNVSSILPERCIIKKPTLEGFKAAYKNINVDIPYENVQKYKLHENYYDNFIDNCLKTYYPDYVRKIEEMDKKDEVLIEDEEKEENDEEDIDMEEFINKEEIENKENIIDDNLEDKILEIVDDNDYSDSDEEIDTKSLEGTKKNNIENMIVKEINIANTKFKINISDENDLIQREILKDGIWEPNLSKVMYELYSESQNNRKIFIDCGSNIGFFSIFLGALGANVVSIEMDESLCKELKRNFKLNGFKNYVIFNNALSSTGGETLYFEERTKNNRGSQIIVDSKTSRTTESVTLDQVINELKTDDVFMMKLDIEGYELKALEGLVDNFDKVNYFIIELAKKIKPVKEILRIIKIFLNKNYKIYDLGYYNQIKNFNFDTFSYKNCNVIDSTNYKKYVDEMYHLTNFLFVKM